VPKEVHVATGPFDDLSDEELSALVHAAKNAVAKLERAEPLTKNKRV
jgi:hypothetical protein